MKRQLEQLGLKEVIDSEEINKAFDYVIVGNERKQNLLKMKKI